MLCEFEKVIQVFFLRLKVTFVNQKKCDLILLHQSVQDPTPICIVWHTGAT